MKLAQKEKVERLPGQPWKLRDAAEFLGCCDRTLTAAGRAGTVKIIRIGAMLYLSDEEVKRAATEGFSTRG